MIRIVPNILSYNAEDFTDQLNHLSSFELIDIDIMVAPFTEQSGVELSEVLKLIKNSKKIYSFHLMEAHPEPTVIEILSSGVNIEQIFIHQEAEIRFIKKLGKSEKSKIGITLKIETRPKDIEFYKDIRAIQLMTGSFGGQGTSFDEKSLAKSFEFREMGFEDELAIDGGVNLSTAKVIKDCPIDRVSVGSFIHKSNNPLIDKMKLDLALNMRTVE